MPHRNPLGNCCGVAGRITFFSLGPPVAFITGAENPTAVAPATFMKSRRVNSRADMLILSSARLMTRGDETKLFLALFSLPSRRGGSRGVTGRFACVHPVRSH